MIGINLIPSRLNVLCNIECLNKLWRRGGLMVSALTPRSSGLGSSPGRGHCVVFLGKTLYSHRASLHPGVQMGTSKYAGGNLAMDQHPIQWGVATLLDTSCKGNRSQALAPWATWACIKALLFFISLNAGSKI